MTEPKEMQELHKIREKIYEDTKHLTSAERTARTTARMYEMQKIYGFKITDLTQDKTKQIKRKA